MLRTLTLVIAVAAIAISPVLVSADEKAEAKPEILFQNVRVWDGLSEKLSEISSVRVVGNKIAEITVGKAKASPGATVIDGGGRTLLPGLIDMHSHLVIHEGMVDGRTNYDQMTMGALTAHRMVDYLQQGFTTARDAGGNLLGIAKAVNNGRFPGPRLFPSGGFLSQTGGHADTGFFNDQPGSKDNLETNGFGYICDGRADVLRAARQNFRAGATQIKIMGGGGVASEFDPIHATQFTIDEMKAAVEIAEDYGSYVLVHAYHDRSVQRAIKAGVRCIEHNFLVSEETIKMMKEYGVALSAQVVMSVVAFANPEEITFFSADQKAKARKVNAGAVQMFEWARKHKLLTVTGGDMFGVDYGPRQADNLIAFVELLKWPPVEVLKTATSNAATVLSWSGDMNPYKEGKLGVIQKDAYADVILVNGNPLEDIKMVGRDNVRVVVKDGKIYKNNLADSK
ncbi:MAG: amidohydrolase family protein [Planctomycetota bacterium]|nr:amidohydrolase family protein [Planctomycetota bacterium]